MTLLVHSTPLALWHSIIHEAEKSCSVVLKEELESYLVFLMMRYSKKPELIQRVMAFEFLRGIKLRLAQRQPALQEVGDQCLLIAGLFPQMTAKRLVKVSYFIHLGQTAYETGSKAANDTCNLLAENFVTLMDVLQAIQQYSARHPNLLPLQAYELWVETGSQRAFSMLKQYTSATPVLVKK